MSESQKSGGLKERIQHASSFNEGKEVLAKAKASNQYSARYIARCERVLAKLAEKVEKQVNVTPTVKHDNSKQPTGREKRTRNTGKGR